MGLPIAVVLNSTWLTKNFVKPIRVGPLFEVSKNRCLVLYFFSIPSQQQQQQHTMWPDFDSSTALFLTNQISSSKFQILNSGVHIPHLPWIVSNYWIPDSIISYQNYALNLFSKIFINLIIKFKFLFIQCNWFNHKKISDLKMIPYHLKKKNPLKDTWHMLLLTRIHHVPIS